MPETNISPWLPWTPAFHHQPTPPFHQDRPWWWEVWSRSNRGWVDRSTNRDVFLFKWPFCTGENGMGGGGGVKFTQIFFFRIYNYVLNLRLAGYISFTQIGKPTWSQLKAAGQLYRPFPLLLCYCSCFLISLKFVWRWCCEASLSVYFQHIFGQVIQGMPFVDGSEMRRPQKGSKKKNGPKISDTLSLDWCKRDFWSLLFSGRRAKKDTKNRMKKVGMCAPGTETTEEASETIGGLQDYTYIIWQPIVCQYICTKYMCVYLYIHRCFFWGTRKAF